MRLISAFEFITLDGYLNGPGGDISWHVHGKEENQYALNRIKSGNILLFGRKTYEMMAAYWPTPLARQHDPILADHINQADKLVFSRTLKKANWENTKILGIDALDEIKRLKSLTGNDMTLLGSGTILSLLTHHGLIDEYQIMIDPVALGGGTSLFEGIKQRLSLKLVHLETFKSGVVLLCYTTQ